MNDAYVNLVLSLMKKSEQISRMVDLGCGDFRVGRRIAGQGTSWDIGCDIVRDVIQRNCSGISGDQVSSFARLILLKTASLMEIFVSSGKFSSTCRTMISQLCSKKIRAYRLILITDEQVLGDLALANCDILPYHGTRRLFSTRASSLKESHSKRKSTSCLNTRLAWIMALLRGRTCEPS